MQNMLEQGPLTFGVGSIQLMFTQYIHANMFSIQMLYTTFQSNCAEGLHFSAFIVYISVIVCVVLMAEKGCV